MKLVGIDIGKNKHFFCIMDKVTGEIIVSPTSFLNNKDGFDFLIQKLKPYSKDSQIIKFAGAAPYHYESSQYNAKHTTITKKGSKYLRKTLYQIILPVIRYNPIFQQYYQLKLSQGKGHRCAQGHCLESFIIF